jgi:4-hydroxybenzoyl-CoA thioesterase
MTFSYEFTVNFGAVDHARVIYYPRFFDFFHRTFEEWFDAALGEPYPSLVIDDNIGLPTVTTQAEFVKPVRFGDRLRVDLEIVAVGRRSITVSYTATRLSDGLVAARATVKKVAIDNDRFVSVDIPETWRRRFEDFMEGA